MWHIPVLASSCASDHKPSLSFSPSLYSYASNAFWKGIQGYLACQCSWLETQMRHTGDRGARPQAHLPLLVTGQEPCMEITPLPTG